MAQALSTTLVACFVVLLSGAVVDSANLLSQPGTDWRRGSLSGDDLRLLESGRYVWMPFCDVCPNDVLIVGTWHKGEKRMTLVPDDAKHPRVELVEMRFGTCDALVDERDLPDVNPLNAFLRWGEDCSLYEGNLPQCNIRL